MKPISFFFTHKQLYKKKGLLLLGGGPISDFKKNKKSRRQCLVASY